ncbi:hypothetical protein CsSME_00019222 [Camellia sinensis var. sinensis]
MLSFYEAFATIDSDEHRRLSSNQMTLAVKCGSRGSTSPVTCHHCGISGHVKARCFKLHPELRRRSSRPLSAGTPRIATLIGQLQAQLGSLTASSLGPSSTTATTLAPGTSTAFHDLSLKRIFGKGYECDGLHYFGDLPDEPSSSSLASFLTSVLSAFMSCVFNIQTLELWHARMGHHTHTSYIPYMTRAPSAFDLIHSDVWGPFPMVKTQFHAVVKTVRSDNVFFNNLSSDP